MKKKMSPSAFALLLLLVAGTLCCNKRFDEPPVFSGGDMKPTISIRQLRNMHYMGGFEQVPDEQVIAGVVVANDSSDNLYKVIVIQDSTGGITVRLDGNSLYSDYPVGLKIFIRLKDLWLGDYARMIQQGAGVDRTDPAYPELRPVPQPLFSRYLVRGNLHQPVTPVITTLEQLTDSLQSCLVMINGVEMPASDTGKTYADIVNRVSDNHTIRSCGGASAYLRTSGFASFAGVKTPRGNGSITAVYSVFRTEKQLMIRDTSDMRLDGLRCTGGGAKLLFAEDFESAAVNIDLQLNGWRNLPETGTVKFQVKQASNNKYTEISAFASGQAAVGSWLVSPPVNLSNSANEVLNFSSRDGFDNGATLQVYVSSNYDGGNTPWKAKWTLLKAVFSKGTQAGPSAWVASGNISLSGYSGSVYLAFRYEGADPGSAADKRTTTFQLDNIRIAGN
jgi:hypothetical protein